MTAEELLAAAKRPENIRDACDLLLAYALMEPSEMLHFENSGADIYVIKEPELRKEFEQLADRLTDKHLAAHIHRDGK